MNIIFKTLLLIILYSLNLKATSKSIELSSFNENGQKSVYFVDSTSTFCQKFFINDKLSISDIEIGLFSNKPNTSLFLHIYGEEGQQSIPRNSIDLIEPIKISKTKFGYERIKVKLDKSIELNNSQFFIVLSNLSKGLYIVTDKNENILECENSQDIYTRQYIKNKNTDWSYCSYNFNIKVFGDLEETTSERNICLDNVTEQIFEKEALEQINSINNKTLSIFDINEDGRLELTINNHIYEYDDAIKKYKFSNLNSLMDSNSILNYFNDYNSDGKLDLGQMIKTNREKDSILTHEYKLIITYSINSSNPKKYEQILNNCSNISSVQMYDLNQDSYFDFVITQNSESENLPNLIVINNINSFKEILLKDKNDNSINGVFSYAEINQKSNKNTFDLLVFSQDGEYEQWSIDRNENLKMQEISSNKKKKNIDLSSISIVQDIEMDGISDYIYCANKYYSIKEKEVIGNSKFKKKDNVIEANAELDTDLKRWSIDNSGIEFCDIDNDGDDELFQFVEKSCYQSVMYKKTDNSYRFSKVEKNLASNLGPDGISADINNDGKIDLISYSDGNIQVYMNNGQNSGKGIVLRSINPNLLASGSKISLYTENGIINKDVFYHNAWYFQTPIEQHIGLGDLNKIDSIEVQDIDGNVHKYKNIEINKVNQIEPQNQSDNNNYIAKITAFPNPFTNDIEIKVSFNLNKNIKVEIQDINAHHIQDLYDGIQNSPEITLNWDGYDKKGNEVTKGIYFVVLKHKSYSYSFKIIKQ